MQWERLVAVLSLLISIINGILAMFIYRRRQQPGAKGFLGLIIAIGLYGFGYAFELSGISIFWVKLWLDVEYLGITMIPFFWLVIASDFAGLEGRLKPWVFALLFSFSVINLMMYLTNDFHQLFYTRLMLRKHGSFTVAAFQRGPWYWTNLTYMILALLAGDIILYQIKERTLPLFRKQINLLISGSLIPWLGFVLYLTGVSPWGLDLNPFSFSITGLFAALGLFHFKLFDISPIARDKIFETMRDGVLILDLYNRIVDFNSAAQTILVELNSSFIGYSITDAFPKTPELSRQVLNSLEFIEFNTGNEASRRCIHSRLTPAFSELKEPLGKIIILSDVTEQKQTQAAILNTEKMALLGQMASMITRELNGPLMTIKNTAEDVDQTFDQLWRQIPEFCSGMSSSRKQLFLEIIEKLQVIPCLTTREERDGLQKLSPFLQQLGLENDHNIVRFLVKLGLTEDVTKFALILQDPKDKVLLELILTLALERKDARTIIQAQERTAKIAYALKSYSRTPEVEQPVLTDIRSNVEMVLRMYGNIIKNGIKTTTDFYKVPPINAYPDELQQVWTNLIHNAIQAMEGKGELLIAIYQKGDKIVVEFTDNGPGISEEILPNIFEPLYTTKKPGEGTGIGLTICKKVIQRHHGQILVQSAPGRTRFSVYLPLSGVNIAETC